MGEKAVRSHGVDYIHVATRDDHLATDYNDS